MMNLVTVSTSNDQYLNLDYHDGRDRCFTDKPIDVYFATEVDKYIEELKKACNEARIAELEAERFDDDSLEDIIQCGRGVLQKHTVMEAQYALYLRRANAKRDGEDAS